MEKILDAIEIYAILSVLPLVMLALMFIISAINCWEIWRAIVGLAFLLFGGINFATSLAISNVKES